MPSQCYRRSRNGCVSCRNSRIKCDERHPFCEQCERRGVECAGYKVNLKWVEISDVSADSHAPAKSVVKPRSSLAICPASKPAQANKKKSSSGGGGGGHSTAIIRNPSTGPRLHSPSDIFIFTHWAQSLPDLVYPNPEEYFSMRDPYLAFVWQHDSVLLPAALAAGASHLYALGILPQAEVLERKQRALGKMVACVQQLKLLPASQSQVRISQFISEEAIAASLSLVGLEVIQGSEPAVIVPLLRGMRAQLEERARTLKAAAGKLQLTKPTPVMSVNIKMMAYMDALCCVPCARKPVLDRAFWQDIVMPHCPNPACPKGNPDVVFGYTAEILQLIGDAATLVNDFYNGTVPPEAFVLSRYCLLQELTACCKSLPRPRHQPHPKEESIESSESVRIRTANACIAAALAHGLATKIFLLRADDSESSTDWAAQPSASRHLVTLVERLSDAVAAVPLDTFASTMMIWPMFVLGCESMAVSSRRHQVERLFEKMIEKQRLLNISAALEILRVRIWRTGGIESGITHEEHSPPGEASCQYSQSDWVRLCWQENIQLCTA